MYLIVHVVLGILLGTWAGLSRQLAAICSVILGFIAGVPLAARLAESFEMTGTPARFFIFVLCYAGIALACYAGARLLRGRLEAARMEGYDRHMGAFLGGIQGFLLCAIGTLLMVNIHADTRREIRQRPTGQVVSRTIQGIRDALPQDMSDVLAPYVRSIEDGGPNQS